MLEVWYACSAKSKKSAAQKAKMLWVQPGNPMQFLQGQTKGANKKKLTQPPQLQRNSEEI